MYSIVKGVLTFFFLLYVQSSDSGNSVARTPGLCIRGPQGRKTGSPFPCIDHH